MREPCPTDDLLGAHVERSLDEQEATRVASHLDECEACRQVVIAAVRKDAPRAQLAEGTPSLRFAPLAAAPSLVGTRMGRYELRELIGAGGMGQVFRAYDAELDRELAVKVLRPELARNAVVLAERLVRESRLMAKVAHPSVITVYDVGRTDDDALFIAMELVRGETLGAYLARTAPSWRETVALFERAGAGLAAAHAAGIVHRDFKPDNVLVEGAASKVVVTDFGIAMDGVAPVPAAAPALAAGTDRVARLTATGVAIGTPAYMAPEQLEGGQVDRRADVFAFSVSLWEALFGERPYRGMSVEELRSAMEVRPRLPRAAPAVPARVVRALERGLAVAPDARWPELAPMLHELAAARGRRRRALAVGAAAAVGLVGAGIALLVAPTSAAADPCAAALPSTFGLAIDAATAARLATSVASWHETHAATCHATQDPPQAPAVVACLDARRTEIDAFVAEARRSGPRAAPLIRTVIDPKRCKDPRSGLLVARAPADPAQRIAVAELRYRAFAIEAARDRSEFATALPDAAKLAADTVDAWPPVRAEALYLLGTTQSIGGDNKNSIATLRETAAFAERVHHDYIATNAWIQLIQTSAFDVGDAERAVEYATYADAALDRIGRPPEVEVMYLYYKGSALVELGRATEAEPVLRRAVDLGERFAPQYLPQALLGLGHLLEQQNRFADATAVFRRALARMEPGDTAEHTFHERLGMNLAFLGEAVEAEAEARKAVAIVDRALGDDSIDRALAHASLGQVLQKVGKSPEALAELHTAGEMLRHTLGERNVRYGEALSLEATILIELERYAEADAILARACEIVAFGRSDNDGVHADCLLSRATTQANLKHLREATALVERALEILLVVDGESSARTANAYLTRGELLVHQGKPAQAIPDIEHAITIFSGLQIDPGHLAAAKFMLADLLWATDRPRARQLASEGTALFEHASQQWNDLATDAAEWRRTHK